MTTIGLSGLGYMPIKLQLIPTGKDMYILILYWFDETMTKFPYNGNYLSWGNKGN